MEEIPTFYSGDTISIEFALRDDSGVSSVVAVFAHTNIGAFTYGDPTSRYEDIQLAGDARGQPKATKDRNSPTGASRAPRSPNPPGGGACSGRAVCGANRSVSFQPSAFSRQLRGADLAFCGKPSRCPLNAAKVRF